MEAQSLEVKKDDDKINESKIYLLCIGIMEDLIRMYPMTVKMT